MFPLFGEEFVLTKRHLGLILVAVGLLVIVGMVAAEILSAPSNGFGTVQKMGVVLGAISVLIGLTLLPLGNRPA